MDHPNSMLDEFMRRYFENIFPQCHISPYIWHRNLIQLARREAKAGKRFWYYAIELYWLVSYVGKRLKHSCLIADEEKYFRAKLVQNRETCHGAESYGGFEL
jgi:hypothetical protein